MTLTRDQVVDHMTDDVLKAVKDETERCALLVEMRAEVAREGADRTRKSGSYVARNLWPFWSQSAVIRPRFEQAARDMEEVAKTLDMVAHCIRVGYDTRDLGKKQVDRSKLTDAQIKVLNYVAGGMGGPDSIRRDLRQAYLGLIAQGLIEPITTYRLTSDGEEALREANANEDGHEPGR